MSRVAASSVTQARASFFDNHPSVRVGPHLLFSSGFAQETSGTDKLTSTMTVSHTSAPLHLMADLCCCR
jgi:hypothetical protein